jgi:hypothetical protein
MIMQMYDRPLRALGQWWNAWQPVNANEVEISTWRDDTVRLWMNELDHVVEVSSAGQVENWLVYQVTACAGNKTVITLLRVT